MELRLRRLVADHLGIDGKALGTLVSLRDDLAADSLDLVELAILIEREFGFAVPDRVLQRVRSFGDLVEATVHLLKSTPGQSPCCEAGAAASA